MSAETASGSAALDRWGQWGEDDQRGAQNFITNETVLSAASLVTAGEVVALGMPLGPETGVPSHRKRVERLMSRDGGDYAAGAKRPGGFQFAEEVLSFAAHTGTHVDALAHAWYDDRLYNGFPASSIRSTTGAQRCGAEHLGPIVTRGVLLDFAIDRTTGGLGMGEAISPADLEHAYQRGAVEPRRGDVVLLRTGWYETTGPDPDTYFRGEPGLSVEAARWLAVHEVCAVGADNYAVEVVPFERKEDVFPVHQLLLRDFGVPLIENVVVDELARRRATSFLFVAAPLPLEGGTASPLCPIAVL